MAAEKVFEECLGEHGRVELAWTQDDWWNFSRERGLYHCPNLSATFLQAPESFFLLAFLWLPLLSSSSRVRRQHYFSGVKMGLEWQQKR